MGKSRKVIIDDKLKSWKTKFYFIKGYINFSTIDNIDTIQKYRYLINDIIKL